MVFSVCFVFMTAIIVVNYSSFTRLSRSMEFFEVAEEINSSILEMRRNEKNYFMYRQDYDFEENMTYTNQLVMILQRDKDSLTIDIGPENYKRFNEYVEQYQNLMIVLKKTECPSEECTDVQTRIRGIGQNMLVLADQIVTAERQAINRLLRHMIPLPLVSLVILVVLLAFVVFYIGEKVVRPLARITRESDAVGTGAFQRITPFGDRENEIYRLISAINRMVIELEKRQEQLVQSRKIASIGTFTSGIAHEINNPINNISLILESLVEDGEDMEPDERRKLYQDGLDQADRAGEIIKNLLEFSRAKTPRAEVVDIEEVIDKTARLVNNELHLHDIEFVKDVKSPIPPLRIDKGGLQQVLLNMFLNSIHAIENRGRINVTLSRTEYPSEACITVEDTGPGIPEVHLDKIFDPFFTTKKEGEGTGLGLSVSYNVIKTNGGRIEAGNRPEGGARFSIFLPLGES